MAKKVVELSFNAKLSMLWGVLEPHMEVVLDSFYNYLQGIESVCGLVKGREPVLKAAQYRHWQETFLNGFDDDYYDRTNRIGIAHVKIGLRPPEYIAGYQFIRRELNRVIFEHKTKRFGKQTNLSHQEMVDTLDSVIYTDMISSISAYEAIRKEQENKIQSECLSEFSKDIAKPVESIASATEEFSSSLISIADQTDLNRNLVIKTNEEVQNAANEIRSLDAHVREINDFVTIIEALASQTNLLALNASIEAARAGEAGRGFAVVADEVKKLSQNTEAAAKKISEKVMEVLGATDQAVTSVVASNEHSEGLRDSFESIAVAVSQQRDAFFEINQSVESISVYIEDRSRNLLAQL